MPYARSNEMKIIDFGWPWKSLTTSTVGYPSDSWASCCSCILRLIGGVQRVAADRSSGVTCAAVRCARRPTDLRSNASGCSASAPKAARAAAATWSWPTSAVSSSNLLLALLPQPPRHHYQRPETSDVSSGTCPRPQRAVSLALALFLVPSLWQRHCQKHLNDWFTSVYTISTSQLASGVNKGA